MAGGFRGVPAALQRRLLRPSCGWDGAIKISAVATGQVLRVINDQMAYFTCIRFINSNHVVTGELDGSVRVWDISRGEQVSRLVKDDESIGEISLGSGGTRIASCGSDLVLSDVPTRALLGRTPAGMRQVNGATFSPDGLHLAIAGCSFDPDKIGAVEVVEVPSLRHVRKITAFKRPATCVTYSPDGRYIAAGDDAGVIKVWKVADTSARYGTPPTGGQVPR